MSETGGSNRSSGMKSVWLVTAASLAAILLPTTSSPAQEFSGGAHFRPDPSAPAGPFVMRRSFRRATGPVLGCDGRIGRGHDGRRHVADGGCAAFAAGFGYFDQDINRSWDPDSFNDWWNDRPDRAYPRWIFHNHNCTPDRMWWSGSGWHC
jgi:hypothetical protein